MFKKGPDIDKKKLLAKASDVKKDSLTRLKHFNTIIEHSDFNEKHSLFKSHFSFIYHTFIDTFSTFDCNSKQRRDDLECILFIFEKIIIYNPELIKKRWQFYSITFVMQKLLHPNNTWQLRQEGIRLFVLWYQILCDDQNAELKQIFASIVPNVVPKSSLPISSPTTPSQMQQQNAIYNQQQQSTVGSPTNQMPQLPIKLCNIEALVPKSSNDQTPNNESSFYLDSLLQCMVTQTTKPLWPEESRKNQELGFSFIFNMFKEIYLQHLFPNLTIGLPINQLQTPSHFMNSSINQYVDEMNDAEPATPAPYYGGGRSRDLASKPAGSYQSPNQRREQLHLDLKHDQQNLYSTSNKSSPIIASRQTSEQERSFSLSNYQAIVIKWLTRILRQDMIPGQDELIRTGGNGSVDRRAISNGQENRDPSSTGQPELDHTGATADGNSTAIFQGIETSSLEMEIARRVIGTWPDNIALVHELFRRAFLNFQQPASMKRVVNVYKEWICSNGPSQSGSTQGARNSKLGYVSFNDLLQVFVRNSSNAFLTQVHNNTMLEEQFEMCKRIMNIYRYMVMKIYMNTPTWEQLLEVMLMITEHLFPIMPPERKESTIGGRIAPAFFQTFIVSWIRANLYVHISSQMWYKFHGIMRDLVRWRELVEEWSTTMGSLTRVLVKHVYGLSLTDLPLERPQERRRRPKALKSFSTAEACAKSSSDQASPSYSTNTIASSKRSPVQMPRPPRSGSVRLPSCTQRGQTRALTRSNSDGVMFHKLRLYYSSSVTANNQTSTPERMRKIKSEYLILTSELGIPTNDQSDTVIMTHTDAIDGSSLKDSMLLEQDQTLDSHHSGKSSIDSSSLSHRSSKKSDTRSNSDKCVLLGGSVRGWTSENSIVMWRRMLGLFGNINLIEEPEIHLITVKCLATILNDFIKTRENLGISLDNQSTPEHPSLIPPYTFLYGWLLEATHLSQEYSESRSNAYSLICTMSIRRHDIELPQKHYITFYEAIQRGLSLPDADIHASIVQNSTQILSLELPGCTFLAQRLYERSRSLLVNSNSNQKDADETNLRDKAVQILNSILSLNRPIKKLMVLKSEATSNSMNLVAPGDIKAKVFETLLACNNSPIVLDSHTRSKSLCSIAIHVYQELCDKSDSLEVEKLFDTIMTEMQDANNGILFRMNCDLLRLYADHATYLTHNRPALVSSLIQTVCQLIVRLSTNENHKDSIQFLLLCLEDWCMAVSKSYLLKPSEHLSASEDDDTLSEGLSDSLFTIVLRSLENVIHDEQYNDDISNRGTRGSMNTSKNSDAQSSGRQSHGRSTTSSGGSHRERTLTNSEQHADRSQQQHDINLSFNLSSNKNIDSIKLACKVSHLKLITYLGHFPFRQIGPASMSCCVNELDYLTTNDQEASDLKNLSGILMLVIDGSTLMSFIGAPRNTEGFCQPIHLIVRNLCGKYAYDASCVESSSYRQSTVTERNEKGLLMFDVDSYQEVASRASTKYDSDFNDDGHSTSSFSSRASSNRDCIGDLLNHLSCFLASANGQSMSSSCLNMQKSKRNSAQSISNSRLKIAQAEETMIALLTNQRFQELNHCEKSDDTERKNIIRNNTSSNLAGDKLTRQCQSDETCLSKIVSFEQCRQLIQQLGYLSWEKRCKVDSLVKSPRLMRELKNLDSQPSRETHKIAVIYVANGQEDKNSILINSSGSRAFEDFVSGLGWEVNLSSHLGFKGGLQTNKSTGETAPYYCNATTEVMFHVSTRIPVNKPVDDESLNRKLRHLGNDEIHIVWSEHVRDYRRGIIPTEFGDVIIAIYPMLTFQGYYRVQISSKQDVPPFGPLFDNCIVHQASLSPLVRATAINASRAKRLKLPYFQAHYEERSRLIESIVQNHREKLSFEEFATQLYTNNEISCAQQGTTGQEHKCCA